MGGNALKNCHTRRYEASEYYVLEKAVLAKLMAAFPERKIAPIKAYAEKPSFGDMDILFQSDNITFDVIAFLQSEFTPAEIVKNDNVYSFEYRQLQVDLILTPDSEFETSLKYYSYNDVGNLLGRIAHPMGLKFGHRGLSYAWRMGTYMFDDVVIERDWKVILPTLGYSYERWANGFKNITDIYEFVISSRYFSRDIFLLHNRNHASRVRDAKRPTYTGFLKWLETRSSDELPDYPRKEDKAEWLPYLFEQLPNFKGLYEQTQARFEASLRANERFNGEVVAKISGLEKQDLGKLMHRIREEFGSKEKIKEWVNSVDDTAIATKVLEIKTLLNLN